MNVVLPGHPSSTLLAECSGVSLYRATDAAQHPRLVQCVLGPSAGLAASLRHESRILNRFSPTIALKPIELIETDSGTFLVHSHFAGEPLASIGTRWSPSDLLQLALTLCDGLRDCHERGVLHRNITPSAVLVEPRELDVRLCLFGSSRCARLRWEPPSAVPLSGYSAPEQSGQVTLDEGEWTDLYGLGATLYFALAGRPPLLASTSRELLHALVATTPPPLRDLGAEVSAGFAALIQRLLAKNPVDRPRRAADVHRELLDLARAHPRTEVTRPRDLRCDAMIGREEALRALVRACTAGSPVALVSGSAGLGKSRLLQALRQALTPGSARSAVGKFDQYRRRPYSAFLDAIRVVTEDLLALPESELEPWKRGFRSIDPALGAVLGQQAPSLKWFLGSPPEPVPLGPTETANRFGSAWDSLLDVLCTAEHPIVLMLDDLQWADEASLALLSRTLVNARRDHLTMVLAWRPEAVRDATTVAVFIQEAQRQASGGAVVRLEPLLRHEMLQLCDEVVEPCRTRDLVSDLVVRHSRGSPFLALEIIRQLARSGALAWRQVESVGAWQLDASAVPRFLMPEAVAQFVLDGLLCLSPQCQESLAAASCAGYRFSAEDVAAASGATLEAVTRDLSEARSDHWVMRLDGGSGSAGQGALYAFCHDRVQQAASRLCSPERRQAFLYGLGTALMRRDQTDRETVFRAADCLQEVPIDDAAMRIEVANLMMLAGEFAKADIAYERAVSSFSRAVELIGALDDEVAAKLAFSCQLQLGESLFLNGRVEDAEGPLRDALRRAGNGERATVVQKTRLGLLLHRQRYTEAIELGVETLRSIGYRLPAKPSVASIMLGVLEAKWSTKGHPTTPEGLRAMPDNQRNRDVLDLLILLSTAAYWTNEKLSLLIGIRLLRAAVRGGTTQHSPMGYAHWAIVNRVVFRDSKRALEFGQLAEALLAPARDPLISSRVRFVVPTFVGSLMRSNRDNVIAYERAYWECLRHGEHVFASHCIDGAVVALPLTQFTIPEIVDALGELRIKAQRVNAEASLELIAVVQSWCAHYLTSSAAVDPELDARLRRGVATEFKNPASIALHRLLRMVTDFVEGAYVSALENYELVAGDKRFMRSNPLLEGLCAMVVVSSISRLPRGRLHSSVRKHLRQLSGFSALYAPNFRRMLCFAEADAHGHGGRTVEAVALLKDALADAVEHGDSLLQALCSERLAAQCERLGDFVQQRELLAASVVSFRQWGAHDKVLRLTRSNPWLRDVRAPLTECLPVAGSGTAWEAMLSSIAAIAETREVGVLAQRLLKILATAVGSQRAYLARLERGQWRVIAFAFEHEVKSCDVPLEDHEHLPQSIVRYVLRTGDAVLLGGVDDPRFDGDRHLRVARPSTSLCVPIQHRGRATLLIYLEDRTIPGPFSHEHEQTVSLLGQQAAAALAAADYQRLQLEAVQARINPHFLYNTLSVISELVFHDAPAAEAALITLARLYRYMLGSSLDQVVSLQEELKVTHDYLTIEKHRFGERLDFTVEVVGVIDDVQVPALLIQPIVENAVRHGVAKNVNGGRVEIYVSRTGSSCTVQISDDGPGPPSIPGSSTGFGLRSVVERLQLLYGQACRVSSATGNGFRVELQFPVSPAPRREQHDVSAAN